MSFLERMNVESYVIPTDASWQMGIGERHGGILKVIHRKVVQETNATAADMEITLLEACLAKNQMARRHGFSPIQHVLGQDIRLPASILNGAGEYASHSRAESEGNFKRRLQLREAARMAWVRLDNSSRIRRAMLAKPRKKRGPWLTGAQVYFWRRGK